MRPPETRKPRRAGRASKAPNADYMSAHALLYGRAKAPRLPDNWRARLPDPASYYAKHVKKLCAPDGNGWARALCPFHKDHNPSLSVHIEGERGGWECFAGCGHGDMVSFHQRLTGLPFKQAVRELIGLSS